MFVAMDSMAPETVTLLDELVAGVDGDHIVGDTAPRAPLRTFAPVEDRPRPSLADSRAPKQLRTESTVDKASADTIEGAE